MKETPAPFTPTAHGPWRVIDGKCVLDVDAAEQAPADASETATDPAPRPKRQRKQNEE